MPLKVTLDNFEEYLQYRLRQFADKGAEIMSQEVPKRSGDLSKAIKVDPEGNGYMIWANKPYAYYVEYGRGEVRPKNKPVLHWVDGGKDVWAMRSSPTKPNDFVGRTVTRLRAVINAVETFD